MNSMKRPRAALYRYLRLLATVGMCAVALVLSDASPALALPTAQELIVNGDFENGAGGWAVATGGDAMWFLDDVGTPTPLQGLPTGSSGGGFGTYAVVDQSGPGVSALIQTFVVPTPAFSVTLSFDMFVNDWASEPIFDPNQTARVDILTATAGPGDLDAGVLFNVFAGTDGGPLPNGFTHYEFNITPFVDDGGAFQLRFFEVDNFNVLNQGVDNVSIQFVPEPSTFTLAAFAPIGMMLGVRRRRKKKWRCGSRKGETAATLSKLPR